MAGKALEIPSGMRGVYGRFARWRSGHRGRIPIPEVLWNSAAELAREYGVFRTAKVLSLDYTKLKRLTGGSRGGPRRTAQSTSPAPAFLELVASGAGSSECLIELEGPRGKMRIQWKGATGSDLAGLSRILWESV